jgi:hypothetical protein
VDGADDDAPVRLLDVLLGRNPSDADALAELALHHRARGQLGAASRVCGRVREQRAGATDAPVISPGP